PLPAGPHLAALLPSLLLHRGADQLDDHGEVVGGRGPGGHVRRARHVWSWAILLRIVLRPRCAASYTRTRSSSSGARPGRRVTTCEAERLSQSGMPSSVAAGAGVGAPTCRSGPR